MPVVINEVEVLPDRGPAPAHEQGAPAARSEPSAEQVRRLLGDLNGREARRRAT
jgi:hypothetical protein